jgi:hypothetical protein
MTSIMTLHSFFYGAGWVLGFSGVTLFALMLLECVAEGAFPSFRAAASPLVYLFLAAACVHACGWALEWTGVFAPGEVYEHYNLLHAGETRWLELGAVFAPLLLWIPAVREHPGAVLGVTAVTVAPWMAALAAFYFGMRF